MPVPADARGSRVCLRPVCSAVGGRVPLPLSPPRVFGEVRRLLLVRVRSQGTVIAVRVTCGRLGTRARERRLRRVPLSVCGVRAPASLVDTPEVGGQGEGHGPRLDRAVSES